MSSNRIITKGCCPASKATYCPTFKAINCLPGPPSESGTAFTPVYGSLSSTGFFASSNTNVNFNVTGVHNGVTLNIADDSITVNSSGVYTISFSTNLIISGGQGDSETVTFSLSINGVPDTTRQIVLATIFPISSAEFTSIARTDQLSLSENDVLRVFIPTATPNDIIYNNTTLVVTKVA